MEDPELARLVREQRKRQIRTSLLDWCTTALAPLQQTPARHHRLIVDKLQRVAEGTIDRLMVLAPPGSAKSTYSTVLMVPWWFCRNPESAVISASHTTSLADSFGRRVRNVVLQHSDVLGYDLTEDSRAANKWDTNTGGTYITAGVGTAIAGRRADLALVDDPVKSRDAAESEVDRAKVWDWYTGDLYSRLKPKARIVLIMTRWHEDDLGGRLLEQMAAGGDQWDILSLPALCEDPQTDPLGRLEGEALWPEWEDEQALLRKHRVVGEREWISQYQQRPAPAAGILFRVERLVWVDRCEEQVDEWVRAWDLAATEQTGGRDPDWTVGVLMGRTRSGRYHVQDVVRLRGSPMQVEHAIVRTAALDGSEIAIDIPQDPGAAGKGQVSYLASALAGFVVRSSPETGSKETRAMPFAAQVEAGNVSVVQARAWSKLWSEELAAFPFGRKDDQVDASSRAFARLVASSGAQAMIDYYRGQIEAPLATPGGGSRPIVTQDGELIDYYNSQVVELTRDERTCSRCRRPLGSTSVTDGVDRWHPECQR